MGYEAVIGLEVHAQLKTASKIFCGCSTTYGAEPNTHACPICLGLPGILPMLNKKAVEYALMMALATHCRICSESRFARKNYFYPDLPKGYQISQYESPLAEHGWIEIQTDHGTKRIALSRIHLEEDAGKSIHSDAEDLSFIDFNRCGVPLIEVVSEPDISSTGEAVTYLKKLRSILRYLSISDGNMEKGSFRCDANLSLRRKGVEGFGTRTELKNMNSFRHVQKALEYEIGRQLDILESGGEVIQETRLWNENEGKSFAMRSKEESPDYRYFPEPDLLPLVVHQEWLDVIRESLPELPDEKMKRFIDQYGLPRYDSHVLTSSRELADYFELCIRETGDAKMVSNWIMGELLRELKRDDREVQDCPVSPSALADLLKMIKDGTISCKTAKDVLKEMYREGKSAKTIVKDKGLIQISNEAQIASIIEQVLRGSPDQVDKYKKGKTQLLGFFVGQVMKKTHGKANPRLVNEILKRALDR
ncbi:MAG: Asp-tRNA(Asn)/Glu-tRNA(Gln) amidotransferase subunit GatB [Desulfatiglandales bacterium]